MALRLVELFCPNCNDREELYENPRDMKATCGKCGGQWDCVKLNEICYLRTRKSDADLRFRYYADGLAIINSWR